MNQKDRLEIIKRLRLFKWMKGKQAPPYRIIIYPTDKCNSNCFFCPLPLTREKNGYNYDTELTRNDLIRIAREGTELGIQEWWIIGGGEPMSTEKTLFLLTNIKKLNPDAYGMLTTNGTLFTEKIIKAMVKIGWDRINFSIDAPDAETHNCLRDLPKAFEKATDAIKTFKNEKNKAGLKKPILYINGILHSYNCEKLTKFVKFAKEIGCDGLVLNQLRVHKEVGSVLEKMGLPISDEKKHKVFYEYLAAKKIARSIGLSFEVNDDSIKKKLNSKDVVTVKNSNKNLQNYYCFEPWLGMLIDAHGYVTPCCPSGGRSKECQVLKQSLHDIWFGKFFEFVRNNIKIGRMLEFCTGCDALSVNERLKNELEREFNDRLQDYETLLKYEELLQYK